MAMERVLTSSAVRVSLEAYLASDGITPATGKTIAITISKNGAAFANPSAGATNATEIGTGSYYVDLSTTDTGTAGPLIVKGTEGTINQIKLHLFVGGVNVEAMSTGVITAAAIADAAIDRATFAADTGQQTIRSNTATAGASTSITLDASASSVTNFYLGTRIFLTGGTGVGQDRIITAYNGTTKVASVHAAWATNPSSGTTFAILPDGSANTVLWNDSNSVITQLETMTGDYGNQEFKVDLNSVLLTALTEGASGRLAGGFVKWFNVASPTGTVNSIPGAIPNANGGLPILSSSGTTLGYTVTTVSTVNALSSGSVTAAALATDAVGEIADGVWDEAIAGHLTAGSTGLALNSASSAGDPWGTALPGAYAAGTAGHILGMGVPDVAPGSANGLLRGGTNAATTFATLTVSGNVVVGGSVTVNSFNVTNDLNVSGELLANRLVLDEFYVDNTFTVVGAALMDNAGNDIKVNVKAVNDVALTGSGVIGDEWGPA